MKPTIAIMTLLLASPAWAVPQCGAPDDNGGSCTSDPANWYLLTKSRGGTISLIKGLTEKECGFTESSAMGRPATDNEKEAARLRQEEDARLYAERNPKCPGVDGDATEQQWKEWRDVHSNASGCTTSNGSMTWNWSPESFSTSPQPSDIVSAECFQ